MYYFISVLLTKAGQHLLMTQLLVGMEILPAPLNPPLLALPRTGFPNPTKVVGQDGVRF